MTLTVKQENFVQEWIKAGNKSEAYRQSYDADNMSDKTINEKASIESSKDKVRARYQELTKASQKRTETTQDTIDVMLKKAWSKAQELNQPSSMVSAANGLAKLHGLIVEKKEHTGKDGAPLNNTITVEHVFEE